MQVDAPGRSDAAEAKNEIETLIAGWVTPDKEKSEVCTMRRAHFRRALLYSERGDELRSGAVTHEENVRILVLQCSNVGASVALGIGCDRGEISAMR